MEPRFRNPAEALGTKAYPSLWSCCVPSSSVALIMSTILSNHSGTVATTTVAGLELQESDYSPYLPYATTKEERPVSPAGYAHARPTNPRFKRLRDAYDAVSWICGFKEKYSLALSAYTSIASSAAYHNFLQWYFLEAPSSDFVSRVPLWWVQQICVVWRFLVSSFSQECPFKRYDDHVIIKENGFGTGKAFISLVSSSTSTCR